MTALLFSGEAYAKTLAMHVDGMHCNKCVEKLKNQLSNVCSTISVSLAKKKAVCIYGDSVTANQILTEAGKTGFKVSAAQ